MLIRIIRTIQVDLKKIIISKDRTNEDIRRRRRAIMLYVPRPKLRILDTESTMWSDPSKAVVPFAIQISEREGGGGGGGGVGQECHRNEANRHRRFEGSRRDVSSSSTIGHPPTTSSFVPFFLRLFRFYPLVIDLISSFCLG